LPAEFMPTSPSIGYMGKISSYNYQCLPVCLLPKSDIPDGHRVQTWVHPKVMVISTLCCAERRLLLSMGLSHT
jgi:hypothetical protein